MNDAGATARRSRVGLLLLQPLQDHSVRCFRQLLLDPVPAVQTIAAMPTTHRVEIVVEASVEAVPEVLGRWGAAAAAGPDTTRTAMDGGALSWPVMFLAALNAKVHRAEPAELRALLRQKAEPVRRPDQQRLRA